MHLVCCISCTTFTGPAHSALSAFGVVRLVVSCACLAAPVAMRASGGLRLMLVQSF